MDLSQAYIIINNKYIGCINAHRSLLKLEGSGGVT